MRRLECQAMRKHSEEVKFHVIKKRVQGKTYKEIGEDLDLPKSTIQYICEKNRDLIQKIIMHLEKYTKDHNIEKGHYKYNFFLEKLLDAVRGSPVDCVGSSNLPQLTTEDREIRKEHARNWIRQRVNFSKVVFSEDYFFSLSGPEDCLTWQLKTNLDENTAKTIQSGGILLWSCISPDGQLVVRRRFEKMTAENYSKFLDESVIPCMITLQSDGYKFQHDDSSIYAISSVTELLESYQVATLPWPLNSFDLNPVGAAMNTLKRKVYHKRKFYNLNQLWQMIHQEVEIINNYERNRIRSLVRQMPDIALAVIARDGKRVQFN